MFSKDGEVKNAAYSWLPKQPTFFFSRITNLVERWTECIEKEADEGEDNVEN